MSRVSSIYDEKTTPVGCRDIDITEIDITESDVTENAGVLQGYYMSKYHI